MNMFFQRARTTYLFASGGGIAPFINGVIKRFKSHEIYYSLRRESSSPIETPLSKIPITIRPLQAEDIPKLLDINNPELSAASIRDRIRRLKFIRQNIPTCYVAVTEAGFPCFLQWLMGAESNTEIQEYFNGWFPILNNDEMLLEFAFTHEHYRGKGILSSATAQMIEMGFERGAKSILGFVNVENIPSLIGCKRAGLSPYGIREDSWKIFRKARKVVPLPPNLPFPFDSL